MSTSPLIGEILWHAGPQPPDGFGWCNGQLLPISNYEALYAVIGLQYGGDGFTTFGLPDLRGRIVVGPASGEEQGSTTGTTAVATSSEAPERLGTAALVLTACICLEGTFPSRS